MRAPDAFGAPPLHEVLRCDPRIEEKRSFLETLTRDALYGTAHPPRIVGKRDEHGRELVPVHGELNADALVHILTAVEKRAAAIARVARTQMVGRTRGDQVVVFDADSSLKGQLLDVEIIGAQSLTLFGRLAPAEAIA